MKLIMFLLLISGAAQGKVLCTAYSANGERNITQICGEEISEGTFNNPRLVDTLRIDWPIAPGLSAKTTADKICKKMHLGPARKFQVGHCSSDQATVNLRGNYAFEFSFKCIDQVSCLSN